MTTMGNRFGIHGLEAASVHSIRDDSEARISKENRPIEVAEVDHRSLVDLVPDHYSDRRRHWETSIPKAVS